MDKITDRIIRILNLKKGNKVILDVGTKDGADSINFVEKLDNSIAYAFEGDPRGKFIKHPKVTYINKAVSNINGKVKWYGSELKDGFDQMGKATIEDKQHYGSSSLTKPKKHLTLQPHIGFVETEVEAIRLDDWIKDQKIENIDLMWVDVNGGEREFLEGAKNTLLEKTFFFVTEFFDIEVFENQINIPEIQSVLNNQFQILEINQNLVSLYNTKFVKR